MYNEILIRIRCRGVGKWYTEERPYIDKDGKEQMKKSLTYNPFLKTKLVGVLGSAFLRAETPTMARSTMTTRIA